MPLPTIPDYTISIKTPQLVHPSILSDGHPIEKGSNVIKYAGGFCVVFPYQTPTKKYAVRCWHAEVVEAKRRTQLIAEAIKASNLPYFVGFEYYEDGIMTSAGKQPIVVMDWVEASPLKKYIAKHLNESDTLNTLAESFKNMVTELHHHHLSHGDLQHGNILVKDDGSLVLVDYDSMYAPSLQGMKDEIKGLQGYQHEGRWKNKLVTEKADYFSELVIYTSIRALSIVPKLWTQLKMEDTETMLFSAEDIKSQGAASIFHELETFDELKPLVDKLCEFLQCSSIDELTPLEENIISPIESISAQWAKGNGFVAIAPKVDIDNPDEISNKWKNGNGYTPPATDDMADGIAAGWKK